MIGRRVGIIGAGAVGATAAYSLAMLGICHEIILYDINVDVAIGKALDIAQSTNYSPYGTIIKAAKKPSELKECDIVVITAGVPRKEGMSRADLLLINAKIMKEVVNNIKTYSPNAIILTVSNPLDVMNYVVYKLTGWERNRVIGMAGALDRARMAYEIHKVLNFGINQIKAMVIGEHGQKMIPIPSLSTVDNISIDKLIDNDKLEEIKKNTIEGGATIVKYLGTSAYYAPGRAVAQMVIAILNDSKIVMPSSVILDGEYGYQDVSVGVPVILGANGFEKVIEIDLDENDKKLFDEAVKSIKSNINILKENNFF